MTEQELRNFVLNLASRYIGCKTGDARHKEIVDTYNNYKPLPRGYKVTYKDQWCMTFVSAIAMMANLSDIVPIECGCGEAVKIAKNKGIWESKSYTPRKGDIVMYDWTSKKDGWADHTGYIEVVGDNYITTIEGNATGGVCARRTVLMSDSQVLGYITPNYASKATKPVIPYEQVMYAESFDKSIAGVYTVKTGLYLRKGAGTKYGSVAVMPKGATVRNYGYYTNVGNTKWLYVKYDNYVGFCSSKYLRKD